MHPKPKQLFLEVGMMGSVVAGHGSQPWSGLRHRGCFTAGNYRGPGYEFSAEMEVNILVIVQDGRNGQAT